MLSTQEQALLDAGMTYLVDPRSDEIPARDREMIARGFSTSTFKTDIGLACTIARDDMITLVVTDGPVDSKTIRHELIHCAQVYAPAEAMDDCFTAAAETGHNILAKVRGEIAKHPEAATGQYRDVLRIATAWEFTIAQGDAAIPPAHAMFDQLSAYYPTKATQELAATVGQTDKDSVYAAMTAAILDELDFKPDPTSDLAREIVAYTFQSADSPSVDRLFSQATEKASLLKLDRLESTCTRSLR